jgi:hypothetical protein
MMTASYRGNNRFSKTGDAFKSRTRSAARADSVLLESVMKARKEPGVGGSAVNPRKLQRTVRNSVSVTGSGLELEEKLSTNSVFSGLQKLPASLSAI